MKHCRQVRQDGMKMRTAIEPFAKYYLGIMLKAYNEFESRVEHFKESHSF